MNVQLCVCVCVCGLAVIEESLEPCAFFSLFHMHVLRCAAEMADGESLFSDDVIRLSLSLFRQKRNAFDPSFWHIYQQFTTTLIPPTAKRRIDPDLSAQHVCIPKFK